MKILKFPRSIRFFRFHPSSTKIFKKSYVRGWTRLVLSDCCPTPGLSAAGADHECPQGTPVIAAGR
ncbi:hypothetical protein KIN20_001268 [Parelaphostrongylus tenuis]|uniref:Uncharacterized protein n=1 Tax=Parelaphostrongylus tenuis TaxID=148309 RepID=A0AAD5LWS1_PARTN|nr:hypothetical protein KIN20_001268 [Parelaphostrongylus tenuis]